MAKDRHVIIIGGGIVGVSAAYFLARRGCSATVLERDTVDTGASTGNAGIIALGHPPLPRPGLIGQTLRMLFTRTNPVYIKPLPSLELLRWLLAFRRACRPDHFHRSMDVLAEMGWLAGRCFDRIVTDEGIGPATEYAKAGWREAFLSEQALDAAREGADLARQYGYAAEVIVGRDVEQHDPAFLEDVRGLIHYPDSSFAHPRKFTVELAEAARKHGATIRTGCEVQSIAAGDGRFTQVTLSTGERIAGSHLILAAGSWSTALAKQMGFPIPMQPGKGYHVELTRPQPCTLTTTVCAETFVAVTPIGGGLRLAGTVELSGLNHQMVQKRLDMLRIGARKYFRDIDGQRVTATWCGLRPCTADGLPAVGKSPRHGNVFVGTGHAMMGFALGPVTGELLVQQIIDGKTDMDLSPLDPGRFGR